MTEFSLNVDEIKENVETTLKEEEKKLEDSNIKNQAQDNAVAIFDADLNNPQAREKILKPLDNFGLNEMSRSAAHNEMLATRFVDLTKGGKESDNIGENLMELNREIKDLDPSKINFAKKGLLGNLMNPVRKYFAKYEKAENAISDIVQSLDKSSKVLQNDNTTLLNEENYLRKLLINFLQILNLQNKWMPLLKHKFKLQKLKGLMKKKLNLFVKRFYSLLDKESWICNK